MCVSVGALKEACIGVHRGHIEGPIGGGAPYNFRDIFSLLLLLLEFVVPAMSKNKFNTHSDTRSPLMIYVLTSSF